MDRDSQPLHCNLDAGQVIAIAANIVINLFTIIGLGTVSIGLWVVVLMQAEVAPIATVDALTSQTAKDLYKTLWIVAQVAFWMTILAALYTIQAGRWFRAYYKAEWADTIQSILTPGSVP